MLNDLFKAFTAAKLSRKSSRFLLGWVASDTAFCKTIKDKTLHIEAVDSTYVLSIDAVVLYQTKDPSKMVHHCVAQAALLFQKLSA